MKTKLIMLGSLALLIAACSPNQQTDTGSHPGLSLSQREAAQIRNNLGKYPLLDKSYADLKAATDKALREEMEIPQPGEAGGYAHERHKQNYRDMKNAGYMFTFTGEDEYATFVKRMLDAYADLYPTLGPHPLSMKQKPGRLFHQVLNENVWLLNTAQAYDCVYDWLTPAEREKYETSIFLPMVDLISVQYPEEFDRIHNHGMWSTAAVGMIGLAMGNDELVERALYGSKLDSTGGFLAQIEGLFSPDGYYMEGAYYVRYAMRPLLFFSEALERKKPELNIYEFKDQILKKAFYSAVQMTFPNGTFFPINDASQSMNILAPGVVYGTSVMIDRYGFDKNLLGLAKIQGEVYPNGAGLKLVEAYASAGQVSEPTWPSIEFVDGADGLQGGFGILRTGQGRDQTLLAMKYGVHGLGHGHFDELNFIYFDQESDVIRDYGYARWINIETKYGGRYLPENNSYAKQTIAHNTLVVDTRSQNDAKREAADRVHGKRHFFDASDSNIQVISASANDHYEDVGMQRTLFLIRDERLDYPVVVDVYRVTADQMHVYDMPLHFQGQIMNTNFEYQAHTTRQEPLGKAFGYEHIWKTAEASVESDAQFTWLDSHRYYSYLTDIDGSAEVFFGMTGANDPNFNLRNEPVFVRRTRAKDMVFASVIEPHGYFDEARETSVDVHPSLQQAQVVGQSDEGTVIKILGEDDLLWTLMINNQTADTGKKNVVQFSGQTYAWTGNYKVEIE